MDDVSAEKDSSTSSSSPPYKIIIIDNEKELDILAEKILNDYNNPVLGVDCEAALEMSRFGILCLIQVTKSNNTARFPT